MERIQGNLPSFRAQRSIAHALRQDLEARRSAMTVSLVAVVLLVLVALVGSGCSTTGEQAVVVVRQARVLLRKPLPGDPEWETRRATWLAESDDVAPVVTR